MTHTEIQANVTKTAAFTGSTVDVSGFTGDWTLKLQVGALTAGIDARFTFEDSINDFTASLAGPSFSILGEIDSAQDKVKSIKRQDFHALRIGTGSGVLHLKLAQMGVGSVSYHAWLET